MRSLLHHADQKDPSGDADVGSRKWRWYQREHASSDKAAGCSKNYGNFSSLCGCRNRRKSHAQKQRDNLPAQRLQPPPEVEPPPEAKTLAIIDKLLDSILQRWGESHVAVYDNDAWNCADNEDSTPRWSRVAQKLDGLVRLPNRLRRRLKCSDWHLGNKAGLARCLSQCQACSRCFFPRQYDLRRLACRRAFATDMAVAAADVRLNRDPGDTCARQVWDKLKAGEGPDSYANEWAELLGLSLPLPRYFSKFFEPRRALDARPPLRSKSLLDSKEFKKVVDDNIRRSTWGPDSWTSGLPVPQDEGMTQLQQDVLTRRHVGKIGASGKKQCRQNEVDPCWAPPLLEQSDLRQPWCHELGNEETGLANFTGTDDVLLSFEMGTSRPTGSNQDVTIRDYDADDDHDAPVLSTSDVWGTNSIVPGEPISPIQQELSGQAWIIKPSNLLCGKQIRVAIGLPRILADASQRFDARGRPWCCVIQKYIENPLLVPSPTEPCGSLRKVDLRLWVFVTSWSPLVIFAHRDIYARVATDSYTLGPDETPRPRAHVTNNRAQDNRFSKAAFLNFLSPAQRAEFSRSSWPLMLDAVRALMLAWRNDDSAAEALPNVHPTQSCRLLEFFGLDFALDENMRPWLLEVNLGPDYLHRCETPELVEWADEALRSLVATALAYHLGALQIPTDAELEASLSPRDTGVIPGLFSTLANAGEHSERCYGCHVASTPRPLKLGLDIGSPCGGWLLIYKERTFNEGSVIAVEDTALEGLDSKDHNEAGGVDSMPVPLTRSLLARAGVCKKRIFGEFPSRQYCFYGVCSGASIGAMIGAGLWIWVQLENSNKVL